MATEWLNNYMEALADLEYRADVFNTKEDAEVLKGLFLGRRAHQQHVDIHVIKQLKMFDIL